jgi:hypothetical protein
MAQTRTRKTCLRYDWAVHDHHPHRAHRVLPTTLTIRIPHSHIPTHVRHSSARHLVTRTTLALHQLHPPSSRQPASATTSLLQILVVVSASLPRRQSISYMSPPLGVDMAFPGRTLMGFMVGGVLVMTFTGTRVVDSALAPARVRVRVPATLVVPLLRSPLPKPFQFHQS